ncbi:MAG TPA: hypothetical protein PKK10_14915 [Woeseiaceae bacterium]|nr:hypothetical protein [Woeseiaceae bacterium]
MNFRKLTLTLLATLFMQPLYADLVTLIEAIELSPSNIILPGSLNGTVTFLPCVDECDEDHQRARLTANTKFFVDEKAVKFDVFRQQLMLKRQNKDSYALVSVDTKQNTITSIHING